MTRWDDSASRSPRAPGSLPQGTHPRSEEARTRGGLSGDPGKEGREPYSVLVTRLPGPEGRKCVPPPTRRHPSVNAREEPRGRECSNPERFAHGQRRTAQFAYAGTRRRKPSRGRSPWIRPGKNPTNEDPHDSSPLVPEKKETCPAQDSVSVREEGEKSRRIRKAFVRRQRRKREPEGGPDRRLVRRPGNRSRRTSHPQIQSWCAT